MAGDAAGMIKIVTIGKESFIGHVVLSTCIGRVNNEQLILVQCSW